MFAQQVKFRNADGQWVGGIAVDGEYVIYGGCGSVMDITEFPDGDVIFSETWSDISNTILRGNG